MGVRKLNKFLVSKGLTISHNNMQDFIKSRRHNQNNRNVIAIDFWLYAHKFLHSFKYQNIIFGFWNQIMRFLACGIIPLYVFDGLVPIEKKETIDARNTKRNNITKKIKEIDILQKNPFINLNDMIDPNIELNELKDFLQKKIKRISTNELHNIKYMFNLLGIPYVRANYEADAMCAKLYKEGIITSCLSDDMDMLALGCGSTIKFYQGKIIEYNLSHIIGELGINQDQLIDICIMFGTDYLKHPFHIDCDDIYKMILENGSILETLQSHKHPIFNMDHQNIRIIGENYQNVQEIYIKSIDREIIPNELYNISINLISKDQIMYFFSKIQSSDIEQFSKKINDNINLINHMIKNKLL